MDNPVQVQRSTGVHAPKTRNSVAVQHAHDKDNSFMLNCYAVRWWVVLCSPCCVPLARGYPC
ncbi:MAG: hypothetical protein LBL39_01380 [Planctomycetaceae bacterium]|nr:hypothetical protein [Planctomycetaceae bacterium]